MSYYAFILGKQLGFNSEDSFRFYPKRMMSINRKTSENRAKENNKC